MLVLMEGAAESVVAAYVQVGDPVRIGDRFPGTARSGSGLTHCLVRAGTGCGGVSNWRTAWRRWFFIPDQRAVQQFVGGRSAPTAL